MKKLSMYVFAALIAASTIVSSCKKDDPEPPTPTEPKCYIKSTKEDGKNQSQYVYNANNKVEKINNYGQDGTTIEEYTQITYDGNGRATRLDDYVETEMNSYTTIEYNSSNLPTKARIYSRDSLGGLSEVAQLTNVYNSSNQVTRSNIYFVSNGTPVLFLYQEYTYSSGNVVTEKSYFADEFGNGELTSISDYQYDSKKNPYLLLNIPVLFSGAALSTNNVTSATYKDENGTVTESETYAYTYNGNGYPLTVVTTPSNGTPSTLAIEYTCK
ncbi:MAG: hypothetical protein ACXWDO_09415 [Bacteroidia bacterium]